MHLGELTSIVSMNSREGKSESNDEKLFQKHMLHLHFLALAQPSQSVLALIRNQQSDNDKV